MLIIEKSKKMGPEFEFISGSFYSFKYKFYENDPAPCIAFINYVHGMHPNTKHMHNYIQGINLHYLPKRIRENFVKDWLKIQEQFGTKDELTWDVILRRYKKLAPAIRRYKVNSLRNIIDLKLIKKTDIIEYLKNTYVKDFSMLKFVEKMNKKRGIR